MAHFKASARSVDMLGRQQIAGIPNAINEIFKNAYDAYAKEVRVDYLEDSDLLFIRDNGYGMTREDFENKWLTLGTDSKTIEGKNYVPKNGNRHVLGEKGIGRLSIASIGPSVLVVTRANREGNISKIVTGFVCWTLFEIPGLSIDQIPVPIIETETMPDQTVVASLVTEVTDFYDGLKRDNKYIISEELDERIKRSLEFNFYSPKGLSHQYTASAVGNTYSSLYLGDNLNGSQFYISPVDPILSELLKSDTLYKKDINDLRKQMLGFYPVFLKDYKPIMSTSFNIYRKDTLLPDDIIAQNEFFSVSDYEKGDHHFEGKFDGKGYFKGIVTIYGKKYPFDTPWMNSSGRIPKCGPFEIRMAYFQGRKNESILSDTDFAYIKEKTHRLGGLYIYKENIRVLPYGDNDVDFLKLEKLRTLGAAYYMFSLRRFIGAILLTNQNNQALKEKAGREGFLKNQAYYDFVSILQDFFESILVNFLRESSNKRISDVYFETKNEIVKQHNIQKAEEEKNKNAQNQFKEKLDEYYEKLNKQRKNQDYKDIAGKIDTCINNNDLPEAVNDKIKKLELLKNELLQYIRIIEENLFLKKPNIPLGNDLFLQYNQYNDEYTTYINEILYSFRDTYLKKIDTALLREGDRLEQDRQFEERINDYRKRIVDSVLFESNTVISVSESLQKNIRTWESDLQSTYLKQFDVIVSNVKRPVQNADEVSDAINSCEKLIVKAKKEITEFYGFIADDLNEINKINPTDESTYSAREAMIAQGEGLIELKNQLENEYELFQLGTAVSIIHHEFGQTAASLKKSIDDLSVWANMNKGLQPLYTQLSVSYNHLDNYLKLFTPLSKRTKSKATDIQGKEITKYICDLFSKRCDDEKITIESTESFNTNIISIDMSVILPVFVNIVDNSLFWLKAIPIEKGRKIQFDINKKRSLIISDNGPGFKKLTEQLIFERGYSTKPGGRGLGMYISKQVLNQEHYDIRTTESQYGKGAGFIIYKKEDGERE
jgi:hypothetical protein